MPAKRDEYVTVRLSDEEKTLLDELSVTTDRTRGSIMRLGLHLMAARNGKAAAVTPGQGSADDGPTTKGE